MMFFFRQATGGIILINSYLSKKAFCGPLALAYSAGSLTIDFLDQNFNIDGD
ncbi:MAG: hypothetical protein ACTS73_09300 [Arsenophonus sp. NEOnobi-MAG3]